MVWLVAGLKFTTWSHFSLIYWTIKSWLQFMQTVQNDWEAYNRVSTMKLAGMC